jgi:hypothetical protein
VTWSVLAGRKGEHPSARARCPVGRGPMTLHEVPPTLPLEWLLSISTPAGSESEVLACNVSTWTLEEASYTSRLPGAGSHEAAGGSRAQPEGWPTTNPKGPFRARPPGVRSVPQADRQPEGAQMEPVPAQAPGGITPVMSKFHGLTFATFLALAVLFASGALLTSSVTAAPKIRSLGGGAWCWFGDPRGVHYANRSYIGWIDQEGDVKVASYDHATRVRTTVVLRWGLQINDHDNPSLHLLPNGRLMVFYSRHSGDKMYYRVSDRARDSRPGVPSGLSPPIRPGARATHIRTRSSSARRATACGSSGGAATGSRRSQGPPTTAGRGQGPERSSAIQATVPTSSSPRTRPTGSTSPLPRATRAV